MNAPVSGRRPKWMQIVAMLRSEIEAMAAERRQRLPTEAELAARFQVSLATVRQALAALQAEGLLARHPRRGTYLTDLAMRGRRLYMLGRVADVFEQQQSDSIRLLSSRRVPVPDHLRTLFAGQSHVRRLVRSRLIAGVVCNHAVNHLREDVAHEIDPGLLASMPVSQVIAQHTRFRIVTMEQEIAAQLADTHMAGLLGIAPLDPVIILIGTSFDARGDTLDTARIVYRADLTRFVNRVVQ